MQIKTLISKTLPILGVALILGNSMAHAGQATFQATQLKTSKSFQPAGMPPPPQCASGFMVKNQKLLTSGGSNKWWVYDCVKQEEIIMVCNPNLSMTNIKFDISSMIPIEGGKRKTRVKSSYSCYHMEG